MTVKQAKKLVCPFIQEMNPAMYKSTDKYESWQGNTKCITSQCMAWRWRTMGDDPEYMRREGKEPKSNPEGYCMRLQQ